MTTTNVRVLLGGLVLSAAIATGCGSDGSNDITPSNTGAPAASSDNNAPSNSGSPGAPSSSPTPTGDRGGYNP